MNKILVFGSLNIDYTYSLDHMVREGETITSNSLVVNAGGKGANQSAALSKAGLDVYMGGIIGRDGAFLKDTLLSYGVDVTLIKETEEDNTGKAIIQLDRDGRNSIILFPGTNRMITSSYIDEVLSHFGKGDWLVLQNEINNLNEIILKAKEKGMRICINPAPFDEKISTLPLDSVDIINVNEIEGRGLSLLSNSSSYNEIIKALGEKFPQCEIILTLGSEGSMCYSKGNVFVENIVPTTVLDTTAAGDTFIGYYLSSRLKGYDEKRSLHYATIASSIAVSRKGAMASIPKAEEVF